MTPRWVPMWAFLLVGQIWLAAGHGAWGAVYTLLAVGSYVDYMRTTRAGVGETTPPQPEGANDE